MEDTILAKRRQDQRKPDPVDGHVGNRIRQRRILLGMSQQILAQALGLTFQQVQKYERGSNRIGSSRLHQFSRILNVPISYFFQDLPPGLAAGGSAGEAAATDDSEHMADRETLELVRAYYRISDETIRDSILRMIETMAKNQT